MTASRQNRLLLLLLVAVIASTLDLAVAADQACAHPVDGSGCDVPQWHELPGEDVVSAAEIATYDDTSAQLAEGDEPAMTGNITHLANLPRGGELNGTGSDMAFWGDYAFQGNYDGLQITDISDPADPRVVSQLRCPGSQNDVSVWGSLVVLSVDSRRSDDSCASSTSSATLPVQDYWEGIRIVDWSDPAAPEVIANVETDCGSHTHTIYPQEDRLVVYVSSYSPSPLYGSCLPPHDKISVVEIPFDDPTAAAVVAEPVLFDDLGLFATRSETGTSGCHDITVLPSRELAAGACMGQGVLMDISDPLAPQVLSSVSDPNFAFWHSATFSNDGDTVIFTDELGGGGGPECNPTVGPERGADALYDISDPADPTFLSYFKIPRTQTNQENCVAHNGVVLPTGPGGRDLFVQAWYQGGITVMDFTDPTNPVEFAWFDRPPFDPSRLVGAGSWSAYWYRGHIFSNGLQEGLDVLRLDDPRIGTAADVREPHLNAQVQCAAGSTATTCL
jgi:hypothetical protein